MIGDYFMVSMALVLSVGALAAVLGAIAGARQAMRELHEEYSQKTADDENVAK